jgi:molecular chaperone DnaJ
MNLKEAYTILEIPQTSTPEEAKKKYRELTKKFHPDVNKSPDAEDKFKKINEAYQVVSTGKSTDREDTHHQNYNPFGGNPFSNFAQQQFYDAQPISIKTTISFKEAILGCEKDIKFNRNTKCTDCNGAGEISLNNGCTQCAGKGQVISRQGSMVFVRSCPKCNGKTEKKDCSTCKADGVLETEASVRVNIPGGVVDGNVLNLRGMGHFVGSFGPMDQHSDAHLHVKVIPEAGLSLVGSDVVSILEISLQEALQGCKKIIKTINGYQDIDVSIKTRNKDEVIIPNLGVNKIGNQRVIMDVRYPEDVSTIIELLNNSENYKVN